MKARIFQPKKEGKRYQATDDHTPNRHKSGKRREARKDRRECRTEYAGTRGIPAEQTLAVATTPST